MKNDSYCFESSYQITGANVNVTRNTFDVKRGRKILKAAGATKSSFI